MATKKKEEVMESLNLSYEDLAGNLKRLGELQREKSGLQSSVDEKISILQEELAKALDPIDAEIRLISLSIKQYMDRNRQKHFTTDKKTLNLETGDLSYRRSGLSVKTKSSQKLIENILEKNNLLNVRDSFVKKMSRVFLRAKLELDKEAILKDPKKAVELTGVEIDEGLERFYLKPYSTNVEMEIA
jgi:phage host-nuclease inhibitor protein Gam